MWTQCTSKYFKRSIVSKTGDLNSDFILCMRKARQSSLHIWEENITHSLEIAAEDTYFQRKDQKQKQFK